MKAIVHIGTEKTGTTSIQKYLYKNRRRLRRAGFHVLQSAGKENSRALAAYCRSDDIPDDYFRDNGITTVEARKAFRQDLRARVNRELSSLPDSIHSVVISSEHFHSRLRTDEEMNRFRRLLTRFFDEVKIVCYIREQVATGESWYSTTLKAGGTSSLIEFMKRCGPTNHYFNYYDSLTQWEQYFGADAMDVSLFSQKHFVNGDLLDDFTAKLDSNLIGRLSRRFRAENESLSPAGQAMARAVNIAFPVISTSEEMHRLRTRCKKIIYRTLRGQGQRLDNDFRLKIYDSFRESNELLRSRYFPQLDELFAAPQAYDPVAVSLEGDFSVALARLQRLFKRMGPKIVTGADTVEFYSAMGTSVTDVIKGESNKASRLQGRSVHLSDSDAQVLSVCAQKLERQTELAHKLMSLVAEINPDFPSVQERLERYSRQKDTPAGENFLLLYSVGETPTDPEKKQAYKKELAKWMHSLNSPFGLPLNWVESADSFGPYETGSEGASPQMDAFSVIQVASLEEARIIAAKCPNRETGGTIELMPFNPFFTKRD